MRHALLLGSLLAAACAPSPPPRWEAGGAPLLVRPARWESSDDDPIEITEDGRVLDDGDLWLLIDRVGRVADDDGEPLAVLFPDGHLAGEDNRLLGRVGVTNGAPPGGAAAWFTIRRDGQVVRFDWDGEPSDAGRWIGCDGPQLRTCALVTQLAFLQRYHRPSGSGVRIGIGVGVGF